jgi:hypothetical protein
MFLVEEKTSRNGQRSAAIYMRADGLFEAHLYRNDTVNSDRFSNHLPGDFEVCGVTETLRPLEAIVDEELGL